MKITRAVAAVGAVLVLAGCTSINTNADEAGLHYSGGATSDIVFQDCIKRGSHEFFGPGDNSYKYPYGERTYEFKDGDGAEQKPITVADKDGNLLTFSGILSFRLNTDCNVLQDFHEAIGLKYGASADGVKDWTQLLNNYLGAPLESALNDAGNTYTWNQLFSNAADRAAFVKSVVEDLLPKYVKNLAKGDYFQKFTLTVQRPKPDKKLTDQIAAQAEAVERINTANAEKNAQAAEQAQIENLVRIFGGWEGYIAYRNQIACEQGGKCIPFIPVPQGGNINVTPGG